MIPHKIGSYSEYCAYQNALWTAYKKATQTETAKHIYDKLMKHIESAYYGTNTHNLLSPEKIEQLKRRMISS